MNFEGIDLGNGDNKDDKDLDFQA
jgi:hypothetical protein